MTRLGHALTDPRGRTKRLWLVAVAFVVLANAAKFVHLDADFPAGMTKSRELYTDEGWYSSNAVSASIGKPWYTPGAWNTAINLPVSPLLQTAVFRLFGTNLITARGLVAAASILLVGAAWLIARRYLSTPWASLLAVLLSVDFFLFGYARLAILDLLMTAITVVAFAIAASVSIMPMAAAALGGALLAVATLTKTTALCALPALIYFCSARERDPALRRRTAALVALSAGLIIVVYNLAAWLAFPSDYLAFHRFAEGEGLARGPFDLLRNFAGAILNTFLVEPIVAPLAIASIVVLSRTSRERSEHPQTPRADLLVRTSLIWLLTFYVMLASRSYQPSRYFVAVVVPLYVLVCAGLERLADVPSLPWGRSACAVAIGALVGLNSLRIADYLARPSYSFVNMTRAVAEIVDRPSNGAVRGVLIGDMAPTLSIAQRVSVLSMGHATWPLAEQIARNCPTHFITLESQDEADAHALSEFYTVRPSGQWDVLGNYYEGRPVRLFTLSPRSDKPRACAPS